MNLGDAFFSNNSNEGSEPVSSITENKTRGEYVFTTISTEVITPPEYRDEFYLQIRSSDLTKARNILDRAKSTKDSKLFEILLGLSSTFLGIFLGFVFLPGKTFNLTSLYSIISPIISLSLAIIFAIGAYSINKIQSIEKNDMAERVLELLVDPNKAKNGDI